MRIAVFDFDRTLFRKDTIIELAKYFYMKKVVHPGYFISQLYYTICYSMKMLSTKQYKEKFLGFLNNLNEKDVLNLLDEFWKYYFPSFFNELLLKEIHSLKARGINIVVVTASPGVFVKPVLKYLEIDYLIATSMVFDHGKVSIQGNNCRGQEKIARLKQTFNLGTTKIVAAYSDNKDDIELLKMADVGYQVNKRGKIKKFLSP